MRAQIGIAGRECVDIRPLAIIPTAARGELLIRRGSAV
jgi:hypothetical protein